MTVYEKSRELGEMLLQTEEGKRMYDAKFVLDGDDEAKQLLFEYNQYRQTVQNQINEGLLSEEDFEKVKQKNSELFEGLRKNSVLKEMLEAESEFNNIVNRAMDILKSTIMGEQEVGCSGSCSSCGGCH